MSSKLASLKLTKNYGSGWLFIQKFCKQILLNPRGFNKKWGDLTRFDENLVSDQFSYACTEGRSFPTFSCCLNKHVKKFLKKSLTSGGCYLYWKSCSAYCHTFQQLTTLACWEFSYFLKNRKCSAFLGCFNKKHWKVGRVLKIKVKSLMQK